jgi:hypothetical protein
MAACPANVHGPGGEGAHYAPHGDRDDYRKKESGVFIWKLRCTTLFAQHDYLQTVQVRHLRKPLQRCVHYHFKILFSLKGVLVAKKDFHTSKEELDSQSQGHKSNAASNLERLHQDLVFVAMVSLCPHARNRRVFL